VSTGTSPRDPARLSTQREAACILHDLTENLVEIRPMQDGSYLWAFRTDAALHDRFCDWGSAEADLEPEAAEDDARHRPRVMPSDEAREMRATLSHELAKILERKGVHERLAQLNAA
jgi:hypothetical protein